MFSYQDIVSYLSKADKTYEEGLLIYNVFRHSNQYDKFFAEAVSPEADDPHFQLLIEQLCYIEQKFSANRDMIPRLSNITENQPEIKLSPVKHVKKEKVRIDEHPYIDINELPVEQFRLYQENKENWSRLKALHAELRVLNPDSTNNERRKGILAQMNNLEKRNQEIWLSIDTWYESRQLNDQKKEDEMLPVEKKIAKYRRQIERIQDYLKKPNLRKATFNKYSAQLQVLQMNLDELIKKPVTSVR